MGVVTHTIQGEASFIGWSMDVKVEGENVDRHLDMMVHNEQCSPADTGPWPFLSKDAQGNIIAGDCQGEVDREKEACADYAPHKENGPKPCKEAGLDQKSSAVRAAEGEAGFEKRSRSIQTGGNKALDCVRARRCQLGPYKPSLCCPTQTPDHVIPKSSFYEESVKGGLMASWAAKANPNTGGYKPNAAPCMCLEGPNNTWANHGLRHSLHKSDPPVVGGAAVPDGNMMPFEDSVSHSCKCSAEVVKSSECSQKCLEQQVRKGHEDMNDKKPPPEVKYSPSGAENDEEELEDLMENLNPKVG
jgi:hypothetical protein